VEQVHNVNEKMHFHQKGYNLGIEIQVVATSRTDVQYEFDLHSDNSIPILYGLWREYMAVIHFYKIDHTLVVKLNCPRRCRVSTAGHNCQNKNLI
jgi:hypothetical protein